MWRSIQIAAASLAGLIPLLAYATTFLAFGPVATIDVTHAGTIAGGNDSNGIFGQAGSLAGSPPDSNRCLSCRRSGLCAPGRVAPYTWRSV